MQRVQQGLRRIVHAPRSLKRSMYWIALLEKCSTTLVAHSRCDARFRSGQWQWLARDGSLFRAFPRMARALYGAGKKGAPNGAVRLHLRACWPEQPVQACVRPGRDLNGRCGSSGWKRGSLHRDRYFGENYKLFYRLDGEGCPSFLFDGPTVIRLKRIVRQPEPTTWRRYTASMGHLAVCRAMEPCVCVSSRSKATIELGARRRPGPRPLPADLVSELYATLAHRAVFSLGQMHPWLSPLAGGKPPRSHIADLSGFDHCSAAATLYGRVPRRMMDSFAFT